MNRTKKLSLLLIVLAAVCLAAFLLSRCESKQEDIKNTDEVILSVAPDEVTALSWEYEDTKLSFYADDSWHDAEDDAFPVSEDKISELLGIFENLSADFIIENAEDISQYGLNKPVCTIRMETADASYTVELGDFSTMDAQRYLSIGDGNVYLVDEDPYDAFAVTRTDMIQNDALPYLDEVSSLTFSGQENYTVTYEEDSTASYCAEDVYFTVQSGKTVPLDTARVESYLSSISYLYLTDYVTYTASDEDLAAYGLDTPELTVSVCYTEEDEDGNDCENTTALSISRSPEDTDVDLSDEDAEVTAYARVGDSKIIYQLSTDDYKRLMAASYDDLRHQNLFTADFDSVVCMEATLDGSSYCFTAEQKSSETVWYYEDEEVELDNLEAALTALCAERFTLESSAQKKEISLSVYLNEEKTQCIRYDLYRYDGETCLVKVDGKPVAVVPRSEAVALMEAVNAIVLG